MTNRERILAILEGKSPDRIPWIPRMLLWWLFHKNNGTLPAKYRGWTLRDIERDLGLGTPARNGRVFYSKLGGVQTVVRLDGLDTVTEYTTPVGTVTSRARRTPELDLSGIEAMEVEKFIKRPADYDVMMYVAENTRYYPCYEEYLDYERGIGDDGYPMVSVGDCPFHLFLQKLAGYDKGYHDLADDPQRVERLLEVMTQKDREEMWPLVAQSPARLVLHGQHFDSQMTPPPMFDRYIKPYYQEFSELLHRNGKTLAMHADNDSRAILSHLSDSGFGMVECFTTAPMVRCTMREAREAWGNSMIIWGGVPAVILDKSMPEEEFERYMMDLFRTIAPGDAFILGVADNVTGASELSRIVRISQMVEEYGSYPVQA